MWADTKNAKSRSSLVCLLALLGSAHVKAACNMLVKYTSGTWIKNIKHYWQIAKILSLLIYANKQTKKSLFRSFLIFILDVCRFFSAVILIEIILLCKTCLTSEKYLHDMIFIANWFLYFYRVIWKNWLSEVKVATSVRIGTPRNSLLFSTKRRLRILATSPTTTTVETPMAILHHGNIISFSYLN